MNGAAPPPSPAGPHRVSLDGREKAVKGLALIAGLFVVTLIVLRICGLVRPFSVPSSGMAPAIAPGDHVLMEGLTFLARKPRRGDIVVFKTDGIPSQVPGTILTKRLAGEPGDHLRISKGKVYVNEKAVALSNALGEIVYNMPRGAEMSSQTTEAVVPGGCYFVLGDNSTNSFDSRFWGPVPGSNIMGRICFCFWPPGRVGRVK